MTPTLEKILEEVKTLSPRRENPAARIPRPGTAAPKPRHLALIRELCGKYKNLSSTEEFIARKQKEIDLEGRRFRQR